MHNVLKRIPHWVDEVILVDGHSTDRTVEVAKKAHPSIKVLYQLGVGKGAALKQGIGNAEGDIIVTLDADGTYPPEEMHRFIRAILRGNDFAKGSRFLHAQPACMTALRRLGNRILTVSVNLLFGAGYTDVCSGYYAFRNGLFQKINLVSNGFDMEQELFVKITKMKLKVTEVPHSYAPRIYGISKTRDLKQGLKDLLWAFSFRFRD